MSGKISGIYVEIKGDASQLKKELKDARQLITEQAHGMSNALANALSPAQIGKSTRALLYDLNSLANASKLTGKEFSSLGVDLGQLRRLTGLTEAQFQTLQTKMLQTSSAQAQERALLGIAKAAGLSSAEVRRLGQQMGVSAASIASVAGVSHQAASGLNALSVAGGMIVARVAAELAMLPKAVLDAGIALDSLQRSFAAIAGSQHGAAEEIEFLRNEADRLGQSFFDLAPAYKNFMAAAKGTALEGAESRKIFSAMIEASTALGISTADTEGALRALTQAMSKGIIMSEEWRGQLAERLHGAFQKLADSMGVSQGELNKLMEQGKVLTHEVLPGFGAAIHAAYGEAAQTAALESGQAAINRMSGAWTDLKVNLYDSDTAVAGINKVAEALKTMAEWANLRSISETFAQGAKMAAEGKFDYQQFVQASFIDRQRMVDQGGPLHTWRGKVNRADVRTASAPIAAATMADAPGSDKAAKAAAKAYEKMLEDGRKAAEAIDAWGDAYDDRRIQAIADSVAPREQALTKDLQLQTEFADKFKAVVLGETEFKLSQIDAQAAAYIKAGSDEVAVAQWVSAEKLKFSRDWQDGATRALQSYADEAGNAAKNVEDVMTMAFTGLEDVVVEFVKTGKLSFSELADSIISDMMRIMIQQSITGPLASGFGSMIGGLFGGGVSSAAGTAGQAGTMSSLMSRSAKGNVFESAGLHAYANTVVSKPTVFPFAKGVGLMGEAGPEAIMPLKRGPDGTLGVRGGGSNVVVNVTNNTSAQASVKESTDSRGNRRVEVVIGEMVAGEVQRQGSAANNSMRNAFGLRPAMARR